jgi:ribose 5-phosphate isomerase B
MRIAVAGDHSAVAHRRAILDHLRRAGHEVEDFGTDQEASCDYPDLAGPACASIASGRNQRGVVVCGTGIGVSIVANKVPGIRCALAHDLSTARLAREHNNTHVLALGARVVDVPTALAMVDTWLDATFEGRHQRRLDKIAALEGCSVPVHP